MSDTPKLTCPECNTPNDEDAPFCENCGFRLRRAPTALEGHKAVSRAQKLKTDRNKPLKVAPRPAVTEMEHPALDPGMRATIPEGVRAVRPKNPVDESATMIEGLRAVATDEDDDAFPATVRHHEPVRESPAYTSGLNSVPAEEQKSSLAVIALLWVVSTSALVLVTYFAAREEPESVVLKADSGPVDVPAGTFKQGLSEQVRAFILMTCTRVAESRDDCDENKLLGGEFPEQNVELPAFRIDSQEVTVGDYAKCQAAGKCAVPDTKACKVYTNQGLQVAFRVPKQLLEDAMPMACVTRSEAAAYCAFADGALPTDAQWEKAARGSRGPLFPWGDNWDPMAANWGEFDVVRTTVAGKVDGHAWAAPPASFEASKSPYGAYDMAGNVWEWVGDGDDVDAHARGGSWASTPFELRTTGRLKVSADTRRADLGFRCAYAPAP